MLVEFVRKFFFTGENLVPDYNSLALASENIASIAHSDFHLIYQIMKSGHYLNSEQNT